MMKLTSALVLSAAMFAAPAFATSHKEAPAMKAGGDCTMQATEKKLAGAAKNSFMKKCEKDMGGAAKGACDMQAKEKKLAGAAKNSFVKKCVADAPKA